MKKTDAAGIGNTLGTYQKTKIKFEIPGPAIPQGRPRVTRFGTYMPKRSKEYRVKVVDVVRRALGGFPPMSGPLCMTIHVTRTPPASWPKKKKAEAVDALGNVYPTSRAVGDVDNLAKAIMDGCTDAGLWVDDSQICTLIVRKSYGVEDVVNVVVYKIGEDYI